MTKKASLLDEYNCSQDDAEKTNYFKIGICPVLLIRSNSAIIYR